MYLISGGRISKEHHLGIWKNSRYELDSTGISIVDVGGHDGFEPYISFIEKLGIPHLCLRDKKWDKSRDSESYRSLGYELEDYLRECGFSQQLGTAKREVGDSKQRVAKWVGQHLKENQIPEFFKRLIIDAINKAQKTKPT